MRTLTLVLVPLAITRYYPNVGRGTKMPPPRTPKRCPVCGERIKRIDARGVHVGGWRERMVYMEHCEANHPDYGDWLNRWRGINGFFFFPAFILALVGYGLQNIPIMIAAVSLFVILYSIWSIHSKRVLVMCREQWEEQHRAPIETDG